jgi:8-oxo-dGTP pyrophosphatase MutT (NUDIX family)
VQPDQSDDDGDGRVAAADGTVYWGRYGAAGLLLRGRRPDGSPAVLLQRRAEWTDHGGTWGLPGGARDRHETVLEAAVRETREETGLRPDQLIVRTSAVTATASGIDWTYTTVLADAPYLLETMPNDESSELRWVGENEVADLPLHPGLAASWQQLRTVMADTPPRAAPPSAQLDPTVDPTDIAGAYATRNPNGATYFRTDNDLLYRDDTRPPAEIFEQGFAPQSPTVGAVLAATAFVSTTRNPDLNFLGPSRPGAPVFRYTIDAPGGIDVNRTEGLDRGAYQQEIAFPGGIRRENIVGVNRVLPREVQRENPDGSIEPTTPEFESFEDNPHFNPQMPNAAPHAPLGPVGGSSAPPSPSGSEVLFRTASDSGDSDDSDDPLSPMRFAEVPSDPESLSDTSVDDHRSSTQPYPPRSVLYGVPPEDPVTSDDQAQDGDSPDDGAVRSPATPTQAPLMAVGLATGIVDAHGNPVNISDTTHPETVSPIPPVFTTDRPSAQLNPDVDATNITGIPSSPENPTGASQHRTDNNLLFRDDSRGPRRIFKRGFAPRQPGETNLSRMVDDNPSAFVSTTRDPNLNHLGPSRPGEPVYRYLIDGPGGVDVNASLASSYGGDHEAEVAFPGGIRTENIVGAQQVLDGPSILERVLGTSTGLTLGDFVPNPNFNPSASNPNFPAAQPLAGLPGTDVPSSSGVADGERPATDVSPPRSLVGGVPVQDSVSSDGSERSSQSREGSATSRSWGGRSLPTPPGDQPVLAAIPHSESTVDEVRGWVGDVNHVGDPSFARSGDRLLNCGPATVVVFHRLSGIASNARADLGNLTPDGVGEATGLGLVPNTRDGIAEYLVGEGPGAHTVVAVRYRDGQQHVFNAFYDGHGVYAVDGQRGTVQPWPPDLDRGANLVRAWFMGTPVHGDGSIFSHPGGTTDFPAGAHSGQRRLSSSDGVPESGVPQQGFAPRVVIAARVPAATAFVSTTRNPILNHLGSPEPDGPVFRYTIDAPGGFDVNRTQGLPRDTYQQEIAFPSAIRRENIIGAEEVPPREDPGGSGDSTTLRFGSFETNPHFNPDLPSAAPPPLGPVGDSSAPPSPALVELRFRTPSDFDDSDEPSSQLISPSHALDDESLSDTGVDDGRSSVPPYPTRSVLHSVPPENPVDEVGPAAEGSGHADGGSASRVFDPGTFGSRPPTPERPSAQLDPSVDPAKIHGVRPSNENVTAAVKFRTDNNPLFRDDTRSPDAVFTTGFAPRDPSNLDLLDHVSAGETGLVSTTRDPELNFLGRSAANGGQVFRFHIDAPGGVDVNPTLGGLGYTHQVEVAFPGGIRRENIKGAEQVLTATKRPATPTLKLADGGDFDVTVGPFIQNPNFNPSAPNTHLRRGPTQPAGASTSAGSDSETEFGPVLDIRAGAFASPGSDSAAEFGPVLDIRAGALGSPGSDSETDSAAEFGPVLDISAGAFASPWPHSTPPLSETRPVDAPPVPPKPGPSRARTGLVPPEAPAPHTLVATSGQSKALPQPTPPEATPPALDTHPEGSVAGRSDSALSYLSDRVIVSMAHGADDGPRSSADDDVPVPLPLLSHPAPPMNPGREAGAGNDLPFRDDTASAGSDVVPMSEGIVAQGDLAANLPVMGTSAGAGASLSRPLPSAAPSAHPAGLPVARTVDTAAPQSATRSGAHARVDAARSQQVGQHHGAAPPDDDLLRSPTPTLVKRRFVPGPPSGRSLPVRPDGSVGSIPDTSRYLRPPAAGGSGGVGGDASVGAGPPPSLSAEPSSVAAGTGVSSGSTDDPRPSRHDNSFLDMSPGPDDSFLDLGEDSP